MKNEKLISGSEGHEKKFFRPGSWFDILRDFFSLLFSPLILSRGNITWKACPVLLLMFLFIISLYIALSTKMIMTKNPDR